MPAVSPSCRDGARGRLLRTPRFASAHQCAFPANFGMFPQPCPLFPFHAFCADKAEHPEVPSGGDVSHGLSLHDTLPIRSPADTVPQLGFGAEVPLLKSFCRSRQQLQAAGSVEGRWDIKAQGGKAPHKPRGIWLT